MVVDQPSLWKTLTYQSKKTLHKRLESNGQTVSWMTSRKTFICHLCRRSSTASVKSFRSHIEIQLAITIIFLCNHYPLQHILYNDSSLGFGFQWRRSVTEFDKNSFSLRSILARSLNVLCQKVRRLLFPQSRMASTSINGIVVPPGFRLHTENTSHILFSSDEAFLNPVQEFNRDLSVACIRVWSEELDRMKEEKWRKAQTKKSNQDKRKKTKGHIFILLDNCHPC